MNQPRTLTFTIPGRLGAWQRARRDSRKGKAFSFTPDKMRADQVLVRQLAADAMRKKSLGQLQGPLRLDVLTYRQPPQSWSQKKQAAARWVTSKPDADNTLKLIADALNHVAYYDDAQIADARHRKQYFITTPECVVITLEELEGIA